MSAFARTLMMDFARGTGLSPAGSNPRRYLWTDAFAVCNFLGFFERDGAKRFLDLALSLVNQVHRTLGRNRPDDPRRGWISGLGEGEGARHPTAGGLRIGKPLPERRHGEPADERLEWEQDGQYYHYLTKWMHALERAGRVAGDPDLLRWAIELAKTAHAGFTYAPRASGPKRLYWKVSIDLSYPLVASMGQHDPLDGFVTYHELQAAARTFPGTSFPGLEDEIGDMRAILRSTMGNLATDDPLGIGGLLVDARRMTELATGGGFDFGEVVEAVLGSALAGLESWARGFSPAEPALYRLAFRELGLSIGLAALADLRKGLLQKPGRAGAAAGGSPGTIEALVKYLPLRGSIEKFWTNGRNRESAAWLEHGDINTVMLATSLDPDGFLAV